jgi:hypothetical protein
VDSRTVTLHVQTEYLHRLESRLIETAENLFQREAELP